MQYNFYIYILFLSIFGASLGFIYKDILKNCTIFQEVFMTSSILLVISGVYCLLYENNMSLLNKLVQNRDNLLLKVLGYSSLLSIIIYVSGILVINENLSKIEPYKQGLKLLAVSMISCLFFKEKLDSKLIVGTFLIAVGIFIMK
tara:strand:+ start:7258 stop:7692 length:435 start_codon:yes stop_codon:yes gene_type:complete